MFHHVFSPPCLCSTVSVFHRVFSLPCFCSTVSLVYRVFVPPRLKSTVPNLYPHPPCLTLTLVHRVYPSPPCLTRTVTLTLKHRQGEPETRGTKDTREHRPHLSMVGQRHGGLKTRWNTEPSYRGWDRDMGD